MVVIRTPPDNVAFIIALIFVFISHVLHPVVSVLFAKVRAYRAWRDVEKKEAVEVTRYNLMAEFLGDRGRWDTPRLLTFLLTIFSIAALGLELSMDLATRTDGPVDLLNRPPPVVFVESGSVGTNDTDWVVQPALDGVDEAGTLDNFKGTLDNGEAAATYRIGDGVMSGLVHGKTLFAWWSTEASGITSTLFYDQSDGEATVEGMTCTKPSRTASVYIDGVSNSWGSATECESGPKLFNETSTSRSSPPTILLTSSTGDMHLLVEEDSSYPSFLYSVWKPVELTSPTLQLRHVFYIATTVRLAEAVVTGIVNGIESGGGCVDLVTQYSVLNTAYILNGRARVSPFGEHPGNSSEAVESLDQVEPIVAGVSISTFGTFCGGLILATTAGALACCLSLHSHKCLDVYDRDQLIRAVSLPNGGEAVGVAGKPHALRIFVRHEASTGISIVISDDGKHRGWESVKQRFAACFCTPVVGDIIDPNWGGSSHSLPPGSREITVEGVRPVLSNGPSQREVGRSPRPMLVELITSPVPSHRGSKTPPLCSALDEIESEDSEAEVLPAPHISRLVP